MTKNILNKAADAVETKSGAAALSAAFIVSPFLSALMVGALTGADVPEGTTQVSQQFEKNAQLRIDGFEAQLSSLEDLKDAVAAQNEQTASQGQSLVAQKEAVLLNALSSFKNEILSNQNIKPQDYQKIAEEFNKHFAAGFPEASSAASLDACRAENTTGASIATCMEGKTSNNGFVLLWLLAIAGAAGAGYTVAQGNVSKNTAKILRKLGQKR